MIIERVRVTCWMCGRYRLKSKVSLILEWILLKPLFGDDCIVLQTNSLGKACNLFFLGFQAFDTGWICFCFLLKMLVMMWFGHWLDVALVMDWSRSSECGILQYRLDKKARLCNQSTACDVCFELSEYSAPNKESTFSEILISAVKSTFSHSNHHKSIKELFWICFLKSRFSPYITHRKAIEVQKQFLGKL